MPHSWRGPCVEVSPARSVQGRLYATTVYLATVAEQAWVAAKKKRNMVVQFPIFR
jgi:hypothetical protein